MTSEKSIVEAIRKYLKSIGAKTYKLHGGPHGHAGAPDIIGSIPGAPCPECGTPAICSKCGHELGIFLADEVKRPGEKPTPLQWKEIRDWKKAGAISGWSDSVQKTKNLLKGEPHE
jgi:hypothetical protein